MPTSDWYNRIMQQGAGGGPGSSARSAGDLLGSAVSGVTSPSRPRYEFPDIWGGQPPPDVDWTPATGQGQDPYRNAGQPGAGGGGSSAGATGTVGSSGGRSYFYGDRSATGSGPTKQAGANTMLGGGFNMPTLQEMTAQGIDPGTAQNILDMVNRTGNVPAADPLNIRELAPWTGRRFYEYGGTGAGSQPSLPQYGV